MALYFALFAALGFLLYSIAGYFSIVFPFSGIVMGVAFAGSYIGINALLKTQGYIYAIEYLKPVWKQLKDKLSQLTTNRQ
jgi:hypothetical protein